MLSFYLSLVNPIPPPVYTHILYFSLFFSTSRPRARILKRAKNRFLFCFFISLSFPVRPSHTDFRCQSQATQAIPFKTVVWQIAKFKVSSDPNILFPIVLPWTWLACLLSHFCYRLFKNGPFKVFLLTLLVFGRKIFVWFCTFLPALSSSFSCVCVCVCVIGLSNCFATVDRICLLCFHVACENFRLATDRMFRLHLSSVCDIAGFFSIFLRTFLFALWFHSGFK